MGTVAALIYALLHRLVNVVQLQGFYFLQDGRTERARWREFKKEGGKNNSSKAWIFYFLPDQIPPFQEINLGMR